MGFFLGTVFILVCCLQSGGLGCFISHFSLPRNYFGVYILTACMIMRLYLLGFSDGIQFGVIVVAGALWCGLTVSQSLPECFHSSSFNNAIFNT